MLFNILLTRRTAKSPTSRSTTRTTPATPTTTTETVHASTASPRHRPNWSRNLWTARSFRLPTQRTLPDRPFTIPRDMKCSPKRRARPQLGGHRWVDDDCQRRRGQLLIIVYLPPGWIRQGQRQVHVRGGEQVQNHVQVRRGSGASLFAPVLRHALQHHVKCVKFWKPYWQILTPQVNEQVNTFCTEPFLSPEV